MTRTIIAIASIWFLVAFGLGAAGAVEKLQPPLPQLVVLLLTIGLLLAFWKTRLFELLVYKVPLQMLLLPHAVRFVGIYFLVLYANGRLPYAFAVPGGWGDIFVAT